MGYWSISTRERKRKREREREREEYFLPRPRKGKQLLYYACSMGEREVGKKKKRKNNFHSAIAKSRFPLPIYCFCYLYCLFQRLAYMNALKTIVYASIVCSSYRMMASLPNFSAASHSLAMHVQCSLYLLAYLLVLWLAKSVAIEAWQLRYFSLNDFFIFIFRLLRMVFLLSLLL